MTLYRTQYKLAVFGPDDTTVLTPAAGAPHADKLLVATMAGVSDAYGSYQPYLDFPRGEGGQRLDVITKRVETGQWSFRILESPIGTPAGTTLQRWGAAFLGDAKGDERLKGALGIAWESLDAGITWTLWRTGRVISLLKGDGAVWLELVFRDGGEELTRARIFADRPRSTVSYAVQAQLWPPGLTGDYGPWKAAGVLTGKYTGDPGSTGWRLVTLDADKLGNQENVISAALQQLMVGFSGALKAAAMVPGSVGKAGFRAKLKRLDTQATGEFGVHAILQLPAGPGFQRVHKIDLRKLPTTDPRYLDYPPTNTAVEVSLIAHGATRPEHPILLNDAHPVQVWKDALDGNFGLLKDDGTVWRSFPYDTTAFATLIADTTIGTGRFVVEQGASLREWIEKHILQPYRLGYFLDEQNRVVPLDLRLPASLAGLPTITDADLREDGVPTWDSPRSRVYSQFEMTLYLERQRDLPELLTSSPGPYPQIPPGRIEVADRIYVKPNIARPGLGENTLRINGLGYRVASTEKEVLDGQKRGTVLERRVEGILEEYRRRFSGGAHEVAVPAQKTNITDGLTIGSWCLVQLTHLPDPATNQLGGTRLMQIVQRAPNGFEVDLRLLDSGLSTTVGAPTIGTLAAESGNGRHGITVPITLHASGLPVRVRYAVTPTSVGSAPADTSPLWTHAATVTATGDLVIRDLPSGMRIWPQARTEPASALQLPSAWVSASTPSRDTTAISAPTSLTVTPTGIRALATWVVADANIEVELRYCTPSSGTPAYILLLPPGSSRHQFQNLAPSTSHKLQVLHPDSHGGYSAIAETTFNTTTGSAPTPADPPGLVVLVGDTGMVLLALRADGTPDPTNPQILRFGVALGVTPSDPGQAVEIEYAPDNGSGAPNTGASESRGTRLFEEAGDVFLEVTPADNALRHFRGRAQPPGSSGGTWSSWIAARPAVLPMWVLKRGSLYPLRRDKPLADGKHAARADDGSGEVLSATVQQSDGVGGRAIAKGRVSSTGRHTDAVTFAVPFENTPMVLLRGGILHEPRAKWGATGSGSETGAVNAALPQYEDLQALGVSPSGFMIRARLRQKAGTTARTDDFTAGNGLDALGETVDANLANAPSVDDTYTVHYDVAVAPDIPLFGKPVITAWVTVAVDSNDGAGWVERATLTYSAQREFADSSAPDTWVDEEVSIVVAGLGVNDDVRLRIKAESTPGVSTFAVHGYNQPTDGDAHHGVTYNTATDSFASKTPDTDDRVSWDALAVT